MCVCTHFRWLSEFTIILGGESRHFIYFFQTSYCIRFTSKGNDSFLSVFGVLAI